MMSNIDPGRWRPPSSMPAPAPAWSIGDITRPPGPPSPIPLPPGPPGPVPPAAPAGPTEEELANASYLYGLLKDTLQEAGLGHLFTWDAATNTPGGFIWTEIVQRGLTDPAQVQVVLESHADYRNRFSVIFALREAAGRGEAYNPDYLDAGTVLRTEAAFTEILQRNMIPPEMYDTFAEKQALMIKGVNPEALSRAIDEAYRRVAIDTPPEVRQAFGTLYGQYGDAALATFFLDPERILNGGLDVISRAAAIAGSGQQQLGFTIDRNRAERLARMGLDYASSREGFANVQEIRSAGLTTELFGEARDMTELDAVDASFNLDQGNFARAFQQRQQERLSAFARAGSTLLTQRGLIGSGRSR